MPVTTPEALIVALAGVTDDHVPPGAPVALPSEVVAPGHTVAVPVIRPASGSINGLTVTTRVTVAAQLPVMV